MKKTLLLTNDDGILSPGIRHLRDFFSGSYDVYVVAPDRQRSAISMSITIHDPLRLKQVSEREFTVDGTPVDCVNIALQKIVPRTPDFLISGMNEGENLCEDVFFSGTVAGAYVGHIYGIPSMAVSMVAGKSGAPLDFERGARTTGEVLKTLLPLQNKSVVYNLNIPPTPGGRLKVTSVGLKHYRPGILERQDPRQQTYYWLGTGEPTSNGAPGSDLHTISEGNISLSVLKYDLNEPQEMKKLTEVFNVNRN